MKKGYAISVDPCNTGKSSGTINKSTGFMKFKNSTIDVDTILNINLKDIFMHTLKTEDVLFVGNGIVETLCKLKGAIWITTKNATDEIIDNNLLIIRRLLVEYKGELNISLQLYEKLTDDEKATRNVGIVQRVK